MTNSITGVWHSHYEYGKGPDNEPQTSNHQIEFIQNGDAWVGTSLPNDEGSEVTITLQQNGDEFRGEWHERTSATGSYGGREFSGVILLRLQPGGAELSGRWLGASSSTNEVKSGAWTLKREGSKI
jgi:hypothetical protein